MKNEEKIIYSGSLDKIPNKTRKKHGIGEFSHKKFDSLTKYISLLKDDMVGEWIIDTENDGSAEHPKHLPFVNYSDTVKSFIRDVHLFVQNNKEYDLYNYQRKLDMCGIDWNVNNMCAVDVSQKDEHLVLALIVAAVRAERFCDGALLTFFEHGSIEKWLKRLSKIDEK